MKLFTTLALLLVVACPAFAVFTPPVPVDGNGNPVPSVYDAAGGTWLTDSGNVVNVGSITATVTTDSKNSIYNGTQWVNDSGVRTIAPYTANGFDTSAGGTVTDTIDLGAVYSVIIVTCDDSCVVSLSGSLTGNAFLSYGDYVDRVLVLPYATRYVYVASSAAYVYPKAIRVRGLR